VNALGRLPHAMVDDVSAPALADDDRHHLTRSLRLRDGDELTVTDGRGRWRVCRLGSSLEPASEVSTVDRPAPALTVAIARTKGDRPELAVQKLTELGIDRIVVFTAERSVARPGPDRLPRQLGRLRRVAREALMQSRGVHLPDVEVASSFAALAVVDGAALADRHGEPLTLQYSTVLIGPEGGWCDAERGSLPRVGLAEQVLRAETAAVTAGVLLSAMRSGLIKPAGQRPSRDVLGGE
jgi:16S rRNA (uracil1498-N3)-methyltransferase